uniref:Uncharacterized protein n=1 Tax=Acetithermum autotrophicum TaxID=1446466 RepID=H5SQB8_ACEAU|nr:hypothetical protein HGMM_OP1C049 [Candidatus Acetothermum autotrophicum]
MGEGERPSKAWEIPRAAEAAYRDGRGFLVQELAGQLFCYGGCDRLRGVSAIEQGLRLLAHR